MTEGAAEPRRSPPPPPSPASGGGRREGARDRDYVIAVRKTDILDALIEHGRLAAAAERDQYRQLCRLLAAIFHFEYFGQLERLRDDYYYFNPEIDPHARFDQATLERAYADLVASLTGVLTDANFVEMSHAEIEAAHRERVVLRVEIEAPLDDYREVRIFRRGHHKERLETSEWFGLRRRTAEVTVHDDVVLFVAVKPEQDIVSKRERKHLKRREIRPGCVLIKYFRNIAGIDLNALFPDVRVIMSRWDKLLLGGPALAGGIPILLKLASTITVLFLVIGFYLGLSAEVTHEQMPAALAALSGLVALGGFIMRQWLRYQRQSLRYQKDLSDNVYFRNVNNNAGIFDYIIGAAEDQECKEVFLAFYFLCTAARPPTRAVLEDLIEDWLRETFGVDLDFKVDEALARLERLRLLVRQGERLAVLPLDAALEHLDEVWAGYFRAKAPAAG